MPEETTESTERTGGAKKLFDGLKASGTGEDKLILIDAAAYEPGYAACKTEQQQCSFIIDFMQKQFDKVAEERGIARENGVHGVGAGTVEKAKLIAAGKPIPVKTRDAKFIPRGARK